jgi:Tfp pilus assembly protein PilO
LKSRPQPLQKVLNEKTPDEPEELEIAKESETHSPSQRVSQLVDVVKQNSVSFAITSIVVLIVVVAGYLLTKPKERKNNKQRQQQQQLHQQQQQQLKKANSPASLKQRPKPESEQKQN